MIINPGVISPKKQKAEQPKKPVKKPVVSQKEAKPEKKEKLPKDIIAEILKGET